MTPNRIVLIYCLKDDTDIPFYVGITVHSLNTRFCQHIKIARKGSDQPVYRKMAELLEQGRMIHPEAIEMCHPRNARQRESYWIKKLSEQGFKLTNVFGAPFQNTKSILDGDNTKEFEDTAALIAWFTGQGMTITALAGKLGISIPHASRLISGKAHVTNAIKWRFWTQYSPELATTLFPTNGKEPAPDA